MPIPLYAVMGNPIDHSLSPLIHQRFAEDAGIFLHYEKREVPKTRFEEDVRDFFLEGGSGLNITLPFKERAFLMADVKTARANEAGAANTLWMVDHKLYADNTDGVGLLRDLAYRIDLENKVIVVLGAGGAARGILGSLLSAKPAQVILSNRTIGKAQALQQIFPRIATCEFTELTGAYDLIINATSASLQDETIPLPKTILINNPLCYDLTYSKDNATPFVEWAKAQGVEAVDGIGMLIEQAAESFYIWHGVRPNTQSMKKMK